MPLGIVDQADSSETSEVCFTYIHSPVLGQPPINFSLRLLERHSIARRQSAPPSMTKDLDDRETAQGRNESPNELILKQSVLRRTSSLGSTRERHQLPLPRMASLVERNRASPLPFSGPSSPTGSSPFASSFAGRVFSGFSEDSAVWGDTPRLDCSPTIPSFDRITFESHCPPHYPPSPTLTPSPQPSLDALDLVTPYLQRTRTSSVPLHLKHSSSSEPPLHHLTLPPLSSPPLGQGEADAHGRTSVYPSSVASMFGELPHGPSGSWSFDSKCTRLVCFYPPTERLGQQTSTQIKPNHLPCPILSTIPPYRPQ